MDDLMSGSNDIKTAIRLQSEITTILAKGGFPLRKWITNSKELLQKIPEDQREGAPVEYDTGIENNVSTLGLLWYHESDKFAFKANGGQPVPKLTKRKILSEIAKIYDPLGFLAPITILNKILMQEIWKEGTQWDEIVSENIKEKWCKMEKQMKMITEFRINRWLNYEKGDRIELHGFSDASEKAYAAVVYAKVWNENKIYISILTSKTRVAPLNNVTLPKLELCAAVLLAELMQKVKKAMNIEINEEKYYSDSEITLAWIKKEPHNWKTFVANRTSKIRTLSNPDNWHYVNTKLNPADFASRGLYPDQLMDLGLWWNGPHFMQTNEELKTGTYTTNLEEKRERLSVNVSTFEEDMLNRFSTLSKATRTIAYCRRLTRKNRPEANQKAISLDEIVEAKKTIVKMTQGKYYQAELDELTKNKQLNGKSTLNALFPFMDNDGIIRVGGRLQNSSFSYNVKHPIIIPYHSKLASLIVDYAHKSTCHGGNQLTLALIRQEYWIPGAKRAVKKHINNCIRCHRFRAHGAQQLMGNLPSMRTQTTRKPFLYTGTDLAGPIQLKMSHVRGTRTQKGYIVIFICLSTRAIHIEVVTDLSSDAFIAAFKRLIGRRGNVAVLQSDNGTNFVGASKILELESEEAIQEYNKEIQDKLLKFSTKFKFNPAASPWMGGIWERNIGSIKYHLKRIVGNRILTYEELSTVLVEIEACLNSRPVCTINDNPDEMEILTPGHFLVGDMLMAPMETRIQETRENRLTRWEICKKMRQEFWDIWSNEYISQLQKRTKWTSAKKNLEEGDIVLVKDEITSPLHWPLGRITRIFPGKDELVRVAEVLCNGKIYKRPVMKLSKLPTGDTEEEEKQEKTKKKEEKEVKEKEEEEKKKKKTRRHTGPGQKMLLHGALIVLTCLINQMAAQTPKQLMRIYHDEQHEQLWLTSAIVNKQVHKLAKHEPDLGVISIYQTAKEMKIIENNKKEYIIEMAVPAEQNNDCYQWKFQRSARISLHPDETYTVENNNKSCIKPKQECRTMSAQMICELKDNGATDCLINLMDNMNKTQAEKLLFATHKHEYDNTTQIENTITITDGAESKTIRNNGTIICKNRCMLMSDLFDIRMFSDFKTKTSKTNAQKFVYIRWEARLSIELRNHEILQKFIEFLRNHESLQNFIEFLRNHPIAMVAIEVLGILVTLLTVTITYLRCKPLDHHKFRFKPKQETTINMRSLEP